MAKPGRKPKPDHLKLVDGDPGKRGINKNAPKPKPVKPSPPKHLDAIARKEWRRMSVVLEKLGLLTVVDGAAFACYCAAYSRWVQAEQEIQAWNSKSPPPLMTYCFETPNGFMQQIPVVGIANQAMKEIRALCAEFGMTPSARSRMTITPDDEDDDMEQLLKGR
jgi:P27 family predicted phage terminase small subunit